MAAPRPFPLQWARQSAGQTQQPADGSRLFDAYAVNPAALPTAPEQPKVQVVINPAPSAWPWLRFNDENCDSFEVNALQVLDTLAYGKYLIGIINADTFFYIKFDGTDLPASYDGRGEELVTFDKTANFIPLALETEDRFDHVPTNIATDGRRGMFTTGTDVFVFDTKDNSLLRIDSPSPDNVNESLEDDAWVDVGWADGYFFLISRGGQFWHSQNQQVEFDQLDNDICRAPAGALQISSGPELCRYHPC